MRINLIGQTLSHYQITAALGSGGMGDVYRATDTKLGRDVALKVLPAETAASSERLERFRREARALAALDHPGIVTVYSVEEADGVHFLTMQLVEGHTLAEIIPEQGLPAEQLMAIAHALAEALAVAHEKGIVHRDLKPANVMLTRESRVKVLDFGLAKLADDENSTASDVEATTRMQTREGLVMGTVPYMSPEQVEGQPVDHRSDIFSLGVILYEMMTGRRPFQGGSTAALMSAILRDEPERPARTDIPETLHTILDGCLNKQPAARIQTAREVLSSLASIAGEGSLTGITGLFSGPPSPAAAVNRPHIVGRQAELEDLRQALAAAQEGQGSLLCVAGEPGIGKSTLVEDFLFEAAAQGRCTVARGRCSERLAGSEAYLPILEAFDSLLQSNQGENLAGIMKQTAPIWYEQIAPLSGQSLESARLLDEIKDANQERLKREFVACVQEVSRSRPLVLFLDDLHWADVSTVDLLSFLAPKFAGSRVLVVVTYRPSDMQISKHPFLQIKPDLQARGLCREIPLGFLQTAEIADYLDLEFNGNGFSPEFPALIHEKTEGSPLFMADLVRYLVDQGAIAEVDGRWKLAFGLPEIELQLPESVRGMIERKIGQLTEEDRALLTAASVQGHVFDSAIISRVLGLSEDEVEDRLDILERVHAFVKLAEEAELPDHTLTLRYRFVHALYQNALYSGLKATRRARLSREIGQAIERVHGDKAGKVAHELAALFESGRDFDRAAQYYLVASRQANRVFADREAAALAERGLVQVRMLEASPERDSLELEIQLALGVALRATKGFGHPETGKAYLRARDLCKSLGEDPRLLSVLFGVWEFYQNQGNYAAALETGQQMLALAASSGDAGQVVAANGSMTDNLLCIGDPVAASEHAAQAMASYDPDVHHSLAHHLGYDPGVSAHCLGALALWLAGFPDQAARQVEAAVALAESLTHPPTRVFAAIFSSWILRWNGSLEEGMVSANKGIELSEEFELIAYRDFGRVGLGWILIGRGELTEGTDLTRQGMAGLAAIDFRWALSFMLAVVAEGCVGQGKVEEGLDLLEEAFDHAEKTGEHFFEPELLRLKGEFFLLRDPANSPAAEACFHQAIEVAQRQQARSWELRATASLARLWWQQGRPAEAREQLKKILGWFTEGLGTADQVAARALLEDLDRGC
jgi:predicted ATPase